MTHFPFSVPFSHNILPTNQIVEVIDTLADGDVIVDAKGFLNALDAEGLALLRRTTHHQRREGNPRFLCGFCRHPLHIRVMSVAGSGVLGGRRAHFVHDPRTENRDCPFGHFADGSSPAEIDGVRFAGRQEGARHRFLKSALRNMLLADPHIATADCEVLVTGLTPDRKPTWRRPDVSAMTIDGRQIAFDVQLASPLIHTIDGRESFYARQGIAWHWIVDVDQLARLQRQGFQDLIWPQGGRVLGFNEKVHSLATKDRQSRFALLHVQEHVGRLDLDVSQKTIGLETAFRIAGFPAGAPHRFATDLRALAFFTAVYHGDLTRAGRIFDLLAATCGTPDWTSACRDHLPDVMSTLTFLLSKRDMALINPAVSNLLNSGDHGSAVDLSNWSFLFTRLAATDIQLRNRMSSADPGTRVMLNAAPTKTASQQDGSQQLWQRWSPLLRRLFPRLAS